MTIFLQPADIDTRDSFAGGVASIGDIYAASRQSMIYVDNTLAADAAMTEAYDRRIEEIFATTGQRLRNPYLADTMDGPLHTPRGGGSQPIEAKRQWFDRKVAELTANIPDRAVADRLSRAVEGEALNIARQADADLSRLASSRGGAGKWAALVAGGLSGSLRDPVQLGTLFLGGGPGAARSVAGRIIATTAKEAVVNGAIEAAMQPSVQAWRAKAGLDHGMDQALRNILFAGLTGGALGGIGQSAAEALRPLLRAGDVDRAAAVAAGDDRLKPELRASLAGDGLKAADSLATIRAELPPAARGALDQADTQLRHLDRSRPAGDGLEHHDVMAARAEAATIAEQPFTFEADPQRVARITDELLPASAADRKPQSLLEFLKARGGVIDDKGELAAIGGEALARKGRGQDRRVPLDMAREAAEEAGYIGRPGAPQATTVRDLLDAIDQELRGRPVHSREDQARLDAAGDIEAERARVESLVTEIAQLAGPAADDATVKAIAELAGREGLSAGDALERVFTAEGERPLVRPPPTDMTDALPEPGAFDDSFDFTAADLKAIEEEGLDIPFFDDEAPIGAAALRDELQRMKDIEAVTAACGIE